MATRAGINYQGRDGELRIYDNSQSSAGAAATPYAYRVLFEQMDFQAGYQARPEEAARLDRQRITDDAHLQLGSDETLYNPVDVSFSMAVSSEHTDAIMEIIGASWAAIGHTTSASWKVKGTPAAGLVSTKARALSGDGQYAGGRVDGRGSIVRLQGFADAKKTAVDVEVIFKEPAGGNKWGLLMKEVNFEPGRQQISESADYVIMRLTGAMYGEMVSISAFHRAIDIMTGQLFS